MSARVVRVVDGRSFMLDDGREIRLAGLEVPLEPGPAADSARSALADLIADATVTVRTAEGTDRYGRTLAHAFLPPDGRSVAHALLARGHARVGTEAGEPACRAELLSQERIARTAKIGLWGDSQYGIMDAENLARLVAGQGRFAVVEGKVWSVRESGGTIYVNFGRRWSQALTVTISKRHGRMFADAGLEPKSLANRRLRVRGWLEVRNGPRIEANRPEQIEFAELNRAEMP